MTHTYINTWSVSHANDPYVALWSIKKYSALSALSEDSTATRFQSSERLGSQG